MKIANVLYIPARVGQSGDASDPAIWRALRIFFTIFFFLFVNQITFVEEGFSLTSSAINSNSCFRRCQNLAFPYLSRDLE